jgi:hypothetical protein
MSLKKAAKYLESKGRNGDSMLVHMTPGEVKGLQALALAHGGSLSVNPHTGLVEASFLKQILPMVAGAALTPFLGPMGAALATGGFEAMRTGDLGRGLMSGLGAYGGANLASGLMAASPAAAQNAAAQNLAKQAVADNATTAGMVEATKASTPSMYEGAKAIYNTPGGTAQFLGANKANLAMAAAPVVSEAMTPKTTMPAAPEEDPRYKGAPYNYRLSSNFAGYTPARPSPFYSPTGLGYAEGGEVQSYGLGGMIPRIMEAFRNRGRGGIPRLAEDFQPYEASRPAEYYEPRGLGYAAQGGSTQDIMMAAGGSYDDEPKGDMDGYAGGGQLGGYSDGGRMLKGPGDGMSDSIPGVIGGRQPARLADGEFVVPADVVSHLGNGSTDAGAKRLYSMMDKVRKARTGTKKQGKQIKPEKYMPA